MATNPAGYGQQSQLVISSPPAIQVTTAPGTSTLAFPVGQVLIVKGASPSAWMLLAKTFTGGVGSANWKQIDNAGGAGAFANLTVTPGPTTLTGIFTTSGGAASINSSSNFATVINDGTSTGAVTIGNALAGIVAIASGADSTITSASASGTALIIEASNAAGGLEIRAGTGGIGIGNQADTTPIAIGTTAPTASRSMTFGTGTVSTAITDTFNIGTGDVDTNAGATKVVNLGTGNVLLGTRTINLGTGTAASGTHSINIGTGTGGGTKRVDIGNADGATTVTLYGVANINNAATATNIAINPLSTGTIGIGGATAGAITVQTGAGIAMTGATASSLTATAGDLGLTATAGSVVATGGEAVIDAVQLTASNAAGGVRVTSGALAATTGLSLLQGAATVNVQVGAGAPAHNAPQGSLYLRTNGTGVNDRAYINTDGAATWTAIVTVA